MKNYNEFYLQYGGKNMIPHHKNRKSVDTTEKIMSDL